MNKLYTAILAMLLTTSGFCQENNTVPGDIITLLSSEKISGELCHDLSVLDGIQTGLHLQRVLSASMHIYLFSFNSNIIAPEHMLNAVKIHEGVKIAQFNHLVNERNTVPDDASFGAMWDMDNTGLNGGAGAVADADIDAPEAWDVTTGGLTTEGDTIVVAVVDGGFKLDHIDLNFWKNYQEIPGNGIDDDNNGYTDDYDGWNGNTSTDVLPIQTHGTHVSGTVGAKGNNSLGVTGVNWNVKVMPVSYGSGSSGTFEANVVASYAYVRDMRLLYNTSGGTKGAFVVSTNSSFGIDLASPSSYPLWCAMYDSLGAVGILSAAATANANYNIDVQGDIPTACPSDWLITVTNTKSDDSKTTSAGYGLTTIDLGAPGTGITSTYYSGSAGSYTDTYYSISGTSMATPHVAGTVALMLSVACPAFIADYKANPSAMALVLKDSLLNATDPIANLDGITVSGGRLNLCKSVNAIQYYCSPVGITESAIEKPQIRNVYPNPSTGNINVAYSGEINVITLTDILGQVILSEQVSNAGFGVKHHRIDISSIAKGIYFVTPWQHGIPGNAMKVVIR